ncbi:MAG: hypothetical protein WDZ46_08055 [Solirubrobacterales bacterium]
MATDLTEGSQDWSLPEGAKPPLLGELVERIDEALATARASEAAVMTVGAAALDAAEQAKRAAELAERASAAIAAAPVTTLGSRATNGASGPANGTPQGPASGPGREEMGDFNARADRVAERLQRLQRLPLSA